MAREKQVSVRFSNQGGDALKADMRQIGQIGKDAMQGIAQASTPASTGLDSVSASVMRTTTQLEQMAARAAQAAVSMRHPLQAQINSMVGAFDSGNRAEDTLFAQQMKAMDDLRAKYNPMFAVIQRYKQQVREIRDANIQQAISEDEKAAAIGRARQAALADIAVIKGRTTSIVQQSRATRMGTFRMQQMFYQVNDIGVSLAGGMNPFIVLAQQGTQIAQIYGFGQGGVSGIFRDLGKMILGVIKGAPVMTALLVAAGAAIAGMTYEINQTTDVAVGLQDTFLAVFQVIGRGIAKWIKPAIDKIAPWFKAAWDAVVGYYKWVGNALIKGIRLTIVGIEFYVKSIPDLFSAAWNRVEEIVFEKLADIVEGVSSALSGITDALNSTFNLNLSAPGADAAQGLRDRARRAGAAADNSNASTQARYDQMVETMRGIIGSDPLGGFFDAVRQQAIDNAKNRAAKDADKGGGKSAKDEIDKLVSSLQKELVVLRESDPVKKKMLEYSDQLADASDEQKKQVLDLVVALDRAKNGWEAITIKLGDYAAEAKRIGDNIGEAITGAFSRAEDAVAEFVKTGKLSFTDMVTSMIADLAKLATRRFITGPLAAGLSSALGGIGGGGGFFQNFTSGFNSYDGGGYTGYGPRSGGLDGKGGFLAMLHPQERVYDEARGQQAAGVDRVYAPVMNVYTRDAESFRRSRSQLASDAQRLLAAGGRVR